MVWDLLLVNGTVYDGLGAPAIAADVGVVGDQIVAVEPGLDRAASKILDCSSLSIAPGFINMLSHPYTSFLRDRVGLSELSQGVTTQLFGEAMAYAPLWPQRRRLVQDAFTREGVDLEVSWDNVAGFLEAIEHAGSAFNVASLVSAGTVFYKAVGGPVSGAPTPAQLAIMCDIVEDEVDGGALGLGTALIYPPEVMLPPAAVLEMARAAGKAGGRYFSHIRSEAAGLLGALDEAMHIAADADMPVEIWHLKAAGSKNWPLMQPAIERIADARDRGLAVAANMYPYTASGSALRNMIPANYRVGREADWLASLDDPTLRATVVRELSPRLTEPDNIVLLRLARPEHRAFQGRTLAEVAVALNLEPAEAVVELVRGDTTIAGMYFTMSEDNVRLAAAQDWISVGSDAAPRDLGGPHDPPVHPRTYGSFARFLGRYSRDQQVVPMEGAIRRMTSQPAERLGLSRRGAITLGNFADLVVFDESEVGDRATFDDPHQLATGVHHVVVNGRISLEDGQPTGTLAGRALTG